MLLIAIALSMDAFAVSIALGLYHKSYALKISSSFGSSQAIMPIVGWSAGIQLKKFISSIDHWLAFLILFFVGLKMIYEADKIKRIEIKKHTILFLSIATSIDALAIGITLPFITSSILLPALIIGITTFFVCLAGFLIAKKIKVGKVEIFGGAILILIGIKILLEHILYR